jgi:hypothetical protein
MEIRSEEVIRGTADRLTRLEQKIAAGNGVAIDAITLADLQKSFNQLANDVLNPLADEFMKLTARVEKLEKENASLEKQVQGLIVKFATTHTLVEARLKAIQDPALKYCGVWQEGVQYELGNFVTFNGSMWHCNSRTSTARPGSGDRAFTLAVKSGQPR